MRKAFYSFMAVAFLVFVMVTLGGCGSSNKSINNGGGQKTSDKSLSDYLDDGEMSSVYDGDEYQAMVQELIDSGSWDKIDLAHHELYTVLAISDEEAEEFEGLIAEEEDELIREIMRSFIFNAEKAKEIYDQEGIILIMAPNWKFINKVYTAVGLEAIDAESEDEKFEIYAITQRKTDTRDHTFTYKALCNDDIMISDDKAPDDSVQTLGSVITEGNIVYMYDSNGNLVSSEDMSGRDTSVNEDVDSNDGDTILFNVGRWRSFYEWLAGISDWVKEQELEASAIELRAAADESDLTKITAAQGDAFDFSYTYYNQGPWSGSEKKATVSRTNVATFSVYTCHSYTQHNDYYLVISKATSTPTSYQDREVGKWYWSDGHKDPVNFISNYTRSFLIECWPNDRNIAWDLNKFYLYDRIPKNLPKTDTHTEGMSWNVGGEIGVNKEGPSAKVSGGVSYSTSKTWTTQEFWAVDNSTAIWVDKGIKSGVQWNNIFEGASKGGYHSDKLYWGVNPVSSAVKTISLESEWIWIASKAAWTVVKRIPMTIAFYSEEGFAHGPGYSIIPPYHWDLTEGSIWYGSLKTMYLDPPKRHWVSQNMFDAGVGGGSAGFNILSEGNWTITGIPDWVHFGDNMTSGSETGDTARALRFEVDANTTGSQRDAYMTFTMKVGVVEESSKIQIHQSSR